MTATEKAVQEIRRATHALAAATLSDAQQDALRLLRQGPIVDPVGQLPRTLSTLEALALAQSHRSVRGEVVSYSVTRGGRYVADLLRFPPSKEAP